MTLSFRSKVQFVDAMKITMDNIRDVAKWCGGEVAEESKNSDATDVYRWLIFPTLDGKKSANINDYLVKDEHGRFSKMTLKDFEEMFEQTASGFPESIGPSQTITVHRERSEPIRHD